MVARFRDSVHMSIVLADAEAKRRGSFSSLTVELELAPLERFLCKTLPRYCRDGDVLLQAEQYVGFAASHSGERLARSEQTDLSCLLSTILNAAPDLPSTSVSFVHSTMGLLEYHQGAMDHAINAFQKALWIETAQESPVAHQIGVTLHRLGLCFSQKGDRREAVAALERAQSLYQSSGVGLEHPCVANIQKELLRLRPSRRESFASAGLRQSFTVRRRVSL